MRYMGLRYRIILINECLTEYLTLSAIFIVVEVLYQYEKLLTQILEIITALKNQTHERRINHVKNNNA
jgi:hypothetical protein